MKKCTSKKQKAASTENYSEVTSSYFGVEFICNPCLLLCNLPPPLKTILTWILKMGSWWMMSNLRLAYMSTLHRKPVSSALQSWSYHLTPSNPPEGKHRNPAWTLFLSASLSLLLMPLVSKPVFGRLNVTDNEMKIFWSRYHRELLITTRSLYIGLSFHTTLTQAYYFHSCQDQKLQNLLSWQHPLLWTVLPNRANLAEVAWNPLEDEKFHQYCITGYTIKSIDLPKQY